MAIPQNYTEMMAFIKNTNEVLQHLMNMEEEARTKLFTPEKQTVSDKERSKKYYEANKAKIALRRKAKRSGASDDSQTSEVEVVKEVELRTESLKTI